MEYHIKDINLADLGREKILWAERRMPVLRMIRERFRTEKPLEGVKVSCCLHVTPETANLLWTLKEAGAKVAVCASNPLSTQDEVAASIVKDFGIPVFAIKGEDEKTYYTHIVSVLKIFPNITVDDGADLVSSLHMVAHNKLDVLNPAVRSWAESLKPDEVKSLIEGIAGGTEETTTGVIRLVSMERKKILLYPIIAVNDAYTKHLFDNRYGTGQSTIDGILRATNLLLSGTKVVVSGYGWCGKGVALRARGMGAHVIVTEVDPIRALEAHLDGYEVMDMKRAAKIGDVFITTTGDINVIRREHFETMKDGAIVGNSGHFNVEIDIPALEEMKVEKRRIRNILDEYVLKDGRRIYLLGEGRLVNLSCAEGHPSEVMDMSFSNQALSIEYIWKNRGKLEKRVLSVPKEIDREVARLKLKSYGIKIDRLTKEQEAYLASWEAGT